MENIRIGNSVHVSWRLYNNNGSQYALSGKIRRLWIISAALEKEITSYGIQGRNEIVFSIPADDLIRYGTYKIRLTIRESESETEDATYDLTQIFQVVSQSYPNASNAIGGVADLSFTSVLNNVVIERIEGLSAYEIAVNNGYEGTEQEWIAMYDNAVTAANNAAEEAIAATETVMANEESRQLAESARDSAEQARMVAEQSRVSAERARAQAEQARQTAEQDRASAEQARVIAETARVAAENARALAEDDRIASEQGRYSEELIRRGQEAERMDAETARRAAETARVSAESARVSAESVRVSAESSRESAEATRASNESARVTAESGRVSAESARVTAEQSRRQQFEGLKTDMETAIENVDAKSAEIAEDIEGYEANEAGRVSAENARATAESARVSAESSRVSAESARATAETARVAQAASDHTRAETDHTRAESDHTRAEEAAAAAEHMVDIKQGPQGPQGNTGSSVDYPYELVNNRTTDDATKGLSAAEGYRLGNDISQLRQEVDGLAPLTEYVGRLESTSAKISNVSTYRYMVVPVKPSDVVKLTAGTGGCFYYVVSEFTFNPMLPYDLVLATGETSKHIANAGNTITHTMPADASYIILRGTIVVLSINGRDVLKSLHGLIQETDGRVDELTERVDYVDIGFSQKFDGIIGNQFVGDLTSGKEIVASATKKYVVISVKGGQVFKYKRTDNPATRFYVVSEFTLNPTLPYNLVLATGETTYHPVSEANYKYSLTLPSDAKYILMQSEVSGVNYLPEYLSLDWENLLNTYTGNLGLTKEVDASSIRDTEGYYRATSPYIFSAESGWYATPLIPVYQGDIIKTNTTVNVPYGTVGHLCFDGNGAFVQVLQMTNGETEISQAMVDAGVRFIGISFNKANTPSPSVAIEREKIEKLETDVSDLSSKVNETENEISVLNRKEKIEIVKNSTAIFYVNVYNKSGEKTTYKFIKYEKVWDSLTYLDGDGNTQTKTNFKSAFAWGNSEIRDKDNTYIAQGNTNFICNVLGDTRHIGDGHGNEVLMVCKFFADGEEFNPVELTETKVCGEFRWIWKSEVYAPNPEGTNTYDGAFPRFDTDGNPIVYFHHYMEGVLNTENEMKLDNRLCIKQDGLKFNEAYAAMLECNYGDFSQVCIANAESTLNAVANDGTVTPVFSDVNLSVNPNQYADKAVMIGNGFVVEQSINVISPKNATPNIHCQFYSNRLKNYLMPVKGNTYKVEDWQLDEFNAGDQIRVLAHRKIDI